MPPKTSSSKKAPNRAYKVRGKNRKEDSSVSSEKIISRIARGRYDGQEEVALLPDGEWRKMGSIPEFYDALISRLLDTNYKPSDSESELEASAPSPQPNESATRQNQFPSEMPPTPEEEVADLLAGPDEDQGTFVQEGGKTSQIAAGTQQIDPSGLNLSELDDLFDDGTQNRTVGAGKSKSNDKKDPNYYRHPALGKADADDLFESGSEDKLDVSENTQTNLPALTGMKIPDEESPNGEPKNSRLKIYALVGLILVALYNLTEPSSAPEPQPQGREGIFGNVEQRTAEDKKAKKEKIEARLNEGDILFGLDSPLGYLRAFELYREALSYDEGHPAALAKVAESAVRYYPHSKDKEQIKSIIRAALKKGKLSDPQSSVLYRVEALYSLAVDDLEKARDAITRAIETDSGSPENALALGEIGYRVRDLEKAKGALEQAIGSPKTAARALYFTAQIYVDLGDLSQAKNAALKVLEVNPFHLSAGVLIADIAYKENDLANAKSLYMSMAKFSKLASPEVAERAFRQLLLIAQAEKNEDEELKYRKIGNYLYPDLSQFEIAADLKNPEEQKLLTEEFVFGKSYFTSQAYGFVYKKRYLDAINYLRAANLLDGDDGVVLYGIAEAIEKKASRYGDFQRVITFYERAIEKDPTLMLAYVKLGMIEAKQYNLKRGLILLKQAEVLAPNSVEPYIALGKFYYMSRDYVASQKYIVQAQKLDPEKSEIYYYAGLLLLLLKSDAYDPALSSFEKAVQLDPTNYDALVEWLKLKVTTYKKSFAVKFIKNLQKDDPKNPNYFWALGAIYSANKEYRRAIDFYKSALDIDNTMSKVRMALGTALEAIGKIKQSIPEYELASRLDRSNNDGFFKAAELLIEGKQVNEAQRVLLELLDRSPNYPGAHRYMARIYSMKKNEKEAIQSMKREVANNPFNIKFRIEAAEMLMKYGEYDEAVKELTQVTNFPEDIGTREFVYAKIRAYIRLSQCYRKLERYEGALGVIRQASRIDSSLPEVQRELGYVYLSLQRNNESAEAFKKYLDQSPTAADAKEINNIIKKSVIPE